MTKISMVSIGAISLMFLGLYLHGGSRRLDRTSVPATRGGGALSAISEPPVAPTFGDHQLTAEQAIHYHMLSGIEVRKFKHYLTRVIGVRIPDSAGSFVGRNRSKRPHDPEWLRGDELLGYSRFAFMLPKNEIPDFIEQLNDRGAAITAEKVPGKAYSLDRVDPRPGRIATSYDWSVGGWQATFEIFTPTGNSQTIYIGINPSEGTVFYASTVDEDD